MEQMHRGPGRPPRNTAVESEVSAEAETNEVPRVRQRRAPFGGMRQKLAYEERPNYHRHWFNDVPGRIATAIEGGYSHVEDKDGKKVSRPVGVADGGAGLIAYLMEIPQEWYDEDMAVEQSRVDEIDRSIRDRGNLQAPSAQDRDDAFYGKVDMKTTKARRISR